MLIILFGLSGTGKNFIGKILATRHGFHFIDADTMLPDDMKSSIEARKPFTQEQRDQFTQIIIKNIASLIHAHKNLVIAQALYKEKNRREIHAAFPDAKFIQVEATTKTILSRLSSRHNWITTSYAEKIASLFEPPSLIHGKIVNEVELKSIEQQVSSLLKKLE
jgi:gluconate kinase